MGYTTDFFGRFDLDKPLSKDQAAYLVRFNETRHLQINVEEFLDADDPLRQAVGLPLGTEGEYFMGGDLHGNGDLPPSTQPGLYCKWRPTDDGEGIEWDEAEKFYDYTEWLEYIINHFLKVWGYTLNGEVEWRGEDYDDVGKIYVKDNVVKILSWNILKEKEFSQI
jgi:hypothetical protein